MRRPSKVFTINEISLQVPEATSGVQRGIGNVRLPKAWQIDTRYERPPKVSPREASPSRPTTSTISLQKKDKKHYKSTKTHHITLKTFSPRIKQACLDHMLNRKKIAGPLN